jgi:GWxTD domain-containing protein
MMKYVLSTILLICASSLAAQPLRDINYAYLYNPAEPFAFDMEAVRLADKWNVLYKLSINDTSVSIDDFTVQWEFRQSLSDKESISVGSIESRETFRGRIEFTGVVSFSLSENPVIFVAKIVSGSAKRAWFFYKVLENTYPVNRYLTAYNKIKVKPYAGISDRLIVSGSDPTIVSYYNDRFPAAPPAFAESQGRVSAGIKADSTFSIAAGSEVVLPMTGLYLIQSDTNSTDGTAFRVENDYPRYTRVSSLVGPMMYICTRDEVNRLIASNNDKKMFDRVVLSITNDTDRARKLMRSYFRRVELANLYFTSYKEGWKTDRGMVYIIFGLPSEVFRFSDREVWNYDEGQKISFTFSKSSSIFDPDNYVLIREKKFRETWLETVDLWRSARF